MKKILFAVSIALTLSVTPAWSQQAAPAYGNETHQGSTPSRTADKASQGQKPASSSSEPVSQERMFGVLPAYGLADAGTHLPPLTSGQKFGLATQYFNPYTFIFVGFESGINQASNKPREYGQGAEGYGKRYGAGFADGLTDTIFTTGVYPSLFHQDPRYYRFGNGGFWHRTGYAASRILVTRQDSGRRMLNVSEILGSFTVVGHRRHLLSREPEGFLARSQSRIRRIWVRCRVQCVKRVLSRYPAQVLWKETLAAVVGGKRRRGFGKPLFKRASRSVGDESRIRSHSESTVFLSCGFSGRMLTALLIRRACIEHPLHPSLARDGIRGH